jgi:hypothetical protein
MGIFMTAFAALAVDYCMGLGSRRVTRIAGRVVAALMIAFAMLRVGDMLHLMMRDPRYDAERWLASTLGSDSHVEVYQPATYLPRFAEGVSVHHVPFKDISVSKFLARGPTHVVVGSAGIASITSKYAVDWQAKVEHRSDRIVGGRGVAGHPLTFEYVNNRRFLEALEQGCLGYTAVASFAVEPVWAPPSIRAIAPTITVYGRDAASRSRPVSKTTDRCRELIESPDVVAG